MKTVAVLGTGTGGLGALHRLKAERVRTIAYDKDPHYGGHTYSYVYPEGFIFDRGPHVSFTKDERIQKLLADNVDGEYETIDYQVNNFWEGLWLTHPVQNHMHGLPVELIAEIIRDFATREPPGTRPIRNYADWLLESYGSKFARTFPMVYTEKYHTTTAANMTTDWIGPRMYRPTLEEVIRGAISPSAPNVHYVTHFRYPSRGGFVSYLHKFVAGQELKLEHEVVQIDPAAKMLLFANGRRAEYDALVSSIPLPDVIRLTPCAPADVREAARKLACTTCVLVNIGVEREHVTDAHISYFYDPNIVFTRLSFPSNMSPHNAPAGCSSIQAEIYFSSKYKPLAAPPESFIEPTIRDLVRCGLIDERDRICLRDAMVCEYANVIFDHDRAPALDLVHGFLEDVGIDYCGRYGDWGYIWTDESFMSGERAAERAIARLGSLRR